MRHHRLILLLGVALTAVAMWFGLGVFGVLQYGGLADTGSESSRAEQLLETRFPPSRPNIVVLVDTPAGVDAPPAGVVARTVGDTLAAVPGVRSVRSYWSAGDTDLRSADGRAGLVTALATADDAVMRQTIDTLSTRVAAEAPGFRVRLGGPSEIVRVFGEETRGDLARTEFLAVPLTLLILVLVFRGLTAAFLPLAIALFAVPQTMLLLRLIGEVVPLSNFALNMSVALGFGLAIDFALLIVRRFREELGDGDTVGDAVIAALRPAGRTVIFSAVTVSCALCGLLLLRLDFLRSFAYAGVAVVLMTALASTTVLPALLVMFGRRVGKPLTLSRAGRRHAQGSGWRRLAVFVMRWPVPVTLVAVAFLVAGALPVRDIQFGPLNDQQLPGRTEAAQVQNALRSQFPEQTGRHEVVVRTGEAPDTALAEYARRLSLVPDVIVVDSPWGRFRDGRVQPVAQGIAEQFVGAGYVRVSASTGNAAFPAMDRALREIRAVPAPAPALVGGETASFADTRSAIEGSLPAAAAAVVLGALVLIFLLTGSVIIPIKAVVINTISLCVPLGAVVWIIQKGHLRWLVGDFQVSGYLDITTAALAFCVAFGLSMDYEVFLLSRIREEYGRSGSTREAVAAGLQRTGGVVTTAALLISIVFVSLATSGLVPFKMLGIGLTVAVVVDATVVRCLLVPAVLRLFGDANWWAPAPLRRLHGALGLRD